ncbi:hypothetical protein G7Y89_g9492 [Cudoniella acicularis]|uniref:Polycomb protein VEFS-Box domain-containing protein n=1 Tax=Cudoniella acicularis TaxID=354080 RepID=A0A8H4W021_9HELO|nr:hypothetical protein G7Y89_g9492 [Cudoniella acicularis]
MSSTTNREEGATVVAHLHLLLANGSGCHPFLQRNARKAVHSLTTMGSGLSVLKAFGARSFDDPELQDEEDDEDPRPAKRRKATNFTPSRSVSRNGEFPGLRKPLDHVTNENARSPQRFMDKPIPFEPLYSSRKPRPAAPVVPAAKPPDQEFKLSGNSIKNILPKDPINFGKALRVDVQAIYPKTEESARLDSTGARGGGRSFEIQCKCSVALFYQKDDSDSESQNWVETCRHVKPCIMHIAKKRDGEITREFEFAEPFVFTAQEFEVRKGFQRSAKRKGPSLMTSTYGLTDKYRLQIYLEPEHHQPTWPPLYVPTLDWLIENDQLTPDSHSVSRAIEDGEATDDEIFFYGGVNNLLTPGNQRTIEMRVCLEQSKKQASGYEIKTHIQWALSSHLSPMIAKPIKKEYPQSATALQSVPVNTVPASPLALKSEHISAPDSPANNRAQRQRSNVATYNLKALSAQAQGRSPRVRRTREVMARDHPDGTSVTYSFGRADAAESGVKQQTVIHSLDCPFCKSHNRSVNHLRLHLQNSHGSFKFSLRRSNPPRIQFFVEIAKARPTSSSSERARTFQLGRPMTLFDLEKFLNGDDSWVRARQGPQHNMWAQHLIGSRANDSSLSSSPHESRHSSPNTSNDTDDFMDLETRKRDGSMKLPVRPKKVLYVPVTGRPLYDTNSKRVLQPGEELPGRDDEKDEGWLHQKHRDAINDFSDLSTEEKAYINQWNPFIMDQNLTSTIYLPDALLRFVQENKVWFAETKSRTRYFTFQCEYFIIRGVITKKLYSTCMDVIRQVRIAKKQNEDDEMDGVEEETAPRHRGQMDCICGASTQPPARPLIISMEFGGGAHFLIIHVCEPRLVSRSLTGPAVGFRSADEPILIFPKSLPLLYRTAPKTKVPKPKHKHHHLNPSHNTRNSIRKDHHRDGPRAASPAPLAPTIDATTNIEFRNWGFPGFGVELA